MLIATAGHVDHGKTRLIHALTGVNTDRTEEEKRRGLSIELGFAFKKIGGNKILGFIDVPGHHRFMNTMIAGVSGIDLGMLVIAADDGPMPQTLEHLQILRLLGVKNILAVMSKIDLVDESRAADAARQIQTLLPGVPICKISTQTGAGLNMLLDILLEKAETCQPQPRRGHFRMYIDRVFTKKGAGVIVTGTALSGAVNIGDTIYLHRAVSSTGRSSAVKVRTLHAQSETVQSGYAGQRCALNLTGKISVDDVKRGDVLCADEKALPATRLDGRFWPGETIALHLQHMGRVKLYIGSRKISAKTYILPAHNGAGQRVQFILQSGIIAVAGDRFLVRGDNEHSILGGGVVIDPVAAKWGKDKTGRMTRLHALEQGSASTALENLIFDCGIAISLKHQQRIWNMTGSEAQHILSRHPFAPDKIVKLAKKDGPLILSTQQWNFYTSHMLRTLADWHKANPKEHALALAKLQALHSIHIPAAIFADVLTENIRAGHITQIDSRVRLSGLKPILKSTLTLGTDKDWARLQALMQDRLPLRSEIEKEIGFDPKKIEAIARPKIKSGALFVIGEKRLGLPATLLTLAEQIFRLYKTSPFTIIEAKNAFGLGRGQTIEILEFFDSLKFTARNGNTRTVKDLDIVREILERETLDR